MNIWLGAYKAVRERVGDLMNKVVLIKDDMRRMDYLKADFFDLVVSYANIMAVESLDATPGGTPPILGQFYRILKKDGRLLTVEPIPPQEAKPVDEAQRLELELIKIHHRILPIYRYYNQSQLSELLHASGFVDIYGKAVSEGEWYSSREVASRTNGLRNIVIELVKDAKEREGLLRQIREISLQAKSVSLRTPPYYALYAKKP